MSSRPGGPAVARGGLFVVSAPSGAGKSTLIEGLFRHPQLRGAGLGYSVSHTTRPPRTGEVDGEHYHFVDPATFQGMVAEGRFLEWAEVHGHRYGTAAEQIDRRRDRGIDIVLDIDVQGAEQVRRHDPGVCSIFIVPPSFHELRRRLRTRNLDHPAEIARRLAVAAAEMRAYRSYHYVIVNDDVAHATRSLAHVVLAHRQHRARMEGNVEHILAGFPQAPSDAEPPGPRGEGSPTSQPSGPLEGSTAPTDHGELP